MRAVSRKWWEQHQRSFEEIDKLADKAQYQQREGALVVEITGQPYYCNCRDEVNEGIRLSQEKTCCWYIVPRKLSREIRRIVS